MKNNKLSILDKQILSLEYKKNRLDEALSGAKHNKWLDVIYKGKLISIDSKGKVKRTVKKKRKPKKKGYFCAAK